MNLRSENFIITLISRNMLGKYSIKYLITLFLIIVVIVLSIIDLNNFIIIIPVTLIIMIIQEYVPDPVKPKGYYISKHRDQYGYCYHIRDERGRYCRETSSKYHFDFYENESCGTKYTLESVVEPFKDLIMYDWRNSHFESPDKVRKKWNSIKLWLSKLEGDQFSYDTYLFSWDLDKSSNQVEFSNVVIYDKLRSDTYIMDRKSLDKLISDFDKKISSKIDEDEKFLKEFHYNFNIEKYVR